MSKGSKKVLMINHKGEIIDRFDSCLKASIISGYGDSCVSRICKGVKISTKGWTLVYESDFKYLIEVDPDMFKLPLEQIAVRLRSINKPSSTPINPNKNKQVDNRYLRKKICKRTRGTVKKAYATPEQMKQDTEDAYIGYAKRRAPIPVRGMEAEIAIRNIGG